MKLTKEQTRSLPFPVGCPVWYNFPEASPSSEEKKEEEKGTPHMLKRGVVESASFHYESRSIVYEVVYRDDDNHIAEEVMEDQLAYGSNCPVSIVDSVVDKNGVEIGAGEGDTGDKGQGLLARNSKGGTVLFCKPSTTNPGKFVYAVMIFIEGTSEARYEFDIDATRIKYRNVVAADPKIVSTTQSNASNADAKVVVKEQKSSVHGSSEGPHHSAKKSHSAPILAGSDRGEAAAAVPSSITCSSNATKNKHNAQGEGSSYCSSSDKKRKVCPPDDDKASKKMQLEPSIRSEMDSKTIPNVTNENGSITRSLMSLDDDHNNRTRLHISVPMWLQRDRRSQEDLYLHLIGSKHVDQGRKKTVADIERESNCDIQVNLPSSSLVHDKHTTTGSVTITVNAISKKGLALRDLTDARRKIQELLLDYVGNDGCKGLLVYELASSCWGAHRPKSSTCHAITASDPFDGDNRLRSITALKLPFDVDSEGRKSYHASYLLNTNFLGRLRHQTLSHIRVVGDEFRVPCKRCDPYVLVVANSFKGCDKAAGMVQEQIHKHQQSCFAKCDD
mmetsp:Transcript_3832/g.7182  ORF Transcript_3832/g.7182 Transcript_3832/m.7182 type:complete len:560 (+) Transcript_3832:185-1864(+)